MIHKGLAFIVRDYRIQASYRLAFFLELFKSLVPTLTFYFIGKVVTSGDKSVFPGSGDYFSFAIVGVALSQYLLISLSSFSETIRRQQMTGCLEAILSTRTSPAIVILLSPLYSFLAKSVHILFIFSVGGWFLGVDFSRFNLLSVVVTAFLSMVCFSSLGILSASVILVIKRGDPITWFMGTFGSILGGAYFPRQVMPEWMMNVSAFNPVTYSIDAMRLAVFQGLGPHELWGKLLPLGMLGVFLLPISTLLFSRSVEKGRRDGTLLHY